MKMNYLRSYDYLTSCPNKVDCRSIWAAFKPFYFMALMHDSVDNCTKRFLNDQKIYEIQRDWWLLHFCLRGKRYLQVFFFHFSCFPLSHYQEILINKKITPFNHSILHYLNFFLLTDKDMNSKVSHSLLDDFLQFWLLSRSVILRDDCQS